MDIGSPQLDHLAAAQRLGVRTVLPVASWDHLSSKSLLRTVPERVILWNEKQRAEAIDMHGVPADRIVVTGAQCYDQWFDRTPALSYQAFCDRVGLRSDRPYILYVCSSLFRGTTFEPAFTERWIQAVRGSADPRLKDIGILVRPHPARLDEWKQVDLTGYHNVAFWGAHPVDAEAKEDYFDSLYYSSAVVGHQHQRVHRGRRRRQAGVHRSRAGDFREQPGRHAAPAVSARRGRAACCARRAVSTSTCRSSPRRWPDTAAATRRRRGSSTASCVRSVAPRPRRRDSSRPSSRSPSMPAPAPDEVRRRGGGRVSAAVAARVRALAAPAHAAVAQAHQEPAAQELRAAEAVDPARVKQRVTDQFISAGKRRKTATPIAASTLTPKAGRQRDPAKTLAGTEFREAKETRELVTVLGRSGKPIILGPWLSETGFELLYWIPFLAWAKAYGNFDPDRLVVVSRGGAAPWYRHITPHYEEIFSFFTPDEFRVANERRIVEQGGRQKHIEVTSFDREILARVQAKRGLAGAELLHPSQMYQLFDNFWLQRTPVTLIEAFSVFTALPAPPPSGILAQLPEQYVAAKFYGNVALPPTPENRQFVTSYLADLASRVDVVLLNTAQRFDDHDDFPPSLRGRLHSIDHLMTPENNLAVQTEVIRGARGFVGTYGGFSYLAPLCGTNTLAFYSHASGFRFDHLEVAKRVFSALRCGTFTEVDLRATDVLRLGFAGADHTSIGAAR